MGIIIIQKEKKNFFFISLRFKFFFSFQFSVASDTEPDSVPPPVPPKNRDSDYFGSNDGNSNRSSGESTDIPSIRDTSDENHYAPVYPNKSPYQIVNLRTRPVMPPSDYITNLSSVIAGKPVDEKRPPTPPPKPSRSNKNTPTKGKKDAENNYE